MSIDTFEHRAALAELLSLAPPGAEDMLCFCRARAALAVIAGDRLDAATVRRAVEALTDIAERSGELETADVYHLYLEATDEANTCEAGARSSPMLYAAAETPRALFAAVA